MMARIPFSLAAVCPLACIPFYFFYFARLTTASIARGSPLWGTDPPFEAVRFLGVARGIRLRESEASSK